MELLTPLGDDCCKLETGFLWPFQHGLFLLLILLFIAINHSCEYSYMQSPVSPLRKPLNLDTSWWLATQVLTKLSPYFKFRTGKPVLITLHIKSTVPPTPLNLLFSSVQFSRSVVSDSLRPHESQHARTPCPSPTPGVHSDSRPSSQWYHPAIPSSVVPFFSCPQSLPASESFPMSQLFTWGGQSTGVSALASFLPNKSQHFINTTLWDPGWKP